MTMIGHNNPPEALQDYLEAKAAELTIKAEELRLVVIPAELDETSAKEMTDLIGKVTFVSKELDKIRTDEKKPYLDAGRTIDGFFKTKIDEMSLIKSRATIPLTAYTLKKREEERLEREAEQKRLQEESDKKAEAARRLEAEGLHEHADKLVKEAVRDEKQANRYQASIESGQGLGVTRAASGATASTRKRIVAEVLSINDLDLEALRHFIPADAIQIAVNRFAANGGRELRGTRIYTEEQVNVRS